VGSGGEAAEYDCQLSEGRVSKIWASMDREKGNVSLLLNSVGDGRVRKPQKKKTKSGGNFRRGKNKVAGGFKKIGRKDDERASGQGEES